MKVIIAGSRSFKDYDRLKQVCDNLLSLSSEIEIVSGGANGADKLGERYADERKLLLKVFPADWDKYGKKAGYIRNEEMARYADALIAFWDRKSKGTHHMIKLAESHNMKIRVIYF